MNRRQQNRPIQPRCCSSFERFPLIVAGARIQTENVRADISATPKRIEGRIMVRPSVCLIDRILLAKSSACQGRKGQLPGLTENRGGKCHVHHGVASTVRIILIPPAREMFLNPHPDSPAVVSARAIWADAITRHLMGSRWFHRMNRSSHRWPCWPGV